MHGLNAWHCAARNNKAAVLPVLLEAAAAAAASETDAAAAGDNPILAKNKDGYTPLALAAYHGAAAAAELLLKAHPPAAGQQDRHGFNPATLAARRGFAGLAAQLQAAAEAAGISGAAVVKAAPAGPAADRRPTLIVAPPQCEKHLTCPDPLPRGIPPPPENVERLRVLVEPGRGILRTDRLAQLLSWELNVAPAPMADILRVHDWNYVRKLQVNLVQGAVVHHVWVVQGKLERRLLMLCARDATCMLCWDVMTACRCSHMARMQGLPAAGMIDHHAGLSCCVLCHAALLLCSAGGVSLAQGPA